ncbi:hypothetical protein A2130_01905 [Candidatus Woesebacteria bacterium GWC2_33_12]|uniref:Uncharacterized protein n=1 Tax=Candidatus Woesebacteria bacterium GW2011_GWB1_33_22 TaxID=1618566 RepID=A0A0G0C1D1_9BACT|nr:MAG: hypothetical protein UR29_C0003G0013 [Candidatus Woesebacteria bacterium GW2011_GWC2_33_12]KKP42254.1 MAG: hypothetical protein UR33_C0004G0013 [Candidatus Woesebacteria bacterium GW2011_GWA2_33_20]KKP44985.1 MAG: hypothetical protein UR35_C0004G0017 [Candidatus Woesebacteria bacterium GW2011_GWB1_33_22]KKP46834.1 MAG: hypothetical protein UR37_C0004G0013 [Microgenomates group bacterium GW2011_GWC1_33_28]KKP50706.1 MAG: hypothetical protein UR41_C0004G0017 [Candidatus Woesebacteria bact
MEIWNYLLRLSSISLPDSSINLITLILLSLTAIAGFLSNKRTSEANELSTLPLLVIKPTGKTLGDLEYLIKNIGNGSAYNIKIEKILHVYLKDQKIHEFEFLIKGVNVIERGEKKVLVANSYSNGEINKDLSEFMKFSIDPREEHKRPQDKFFITFKDARGINYYSRIRTGSRGLTFLIPPKKINMKGYLIIIHNEIYKLLLKIYAKSIWKLRKP